MRYRATAGSIRASASSRASTATKFPRGAGAQILTQPQIWPHADRVYQEAARLIDDHDRSKPMFLYLHFMDVHEYAAPPEFKTFGQDTPGTYLAAIRWDDDALERGAPQARRGRTARPEL
jgi:hypothetical protein